MEVTIDDLDNLRHMLGVTDRTPRGYRNYFVPGGKDVESMERLRAAGFVVKNDGYEASSDPCYHATAEGARAVGLRMLPEEYERAHPWRGRPKTYGQGARHGA